VTWDSPVGQLELIRFPYPGDRSHRAWDAADRRILEILADSPPPPEECLVIGEDFGVLSAALLRSDRDAPHRRKPSDGSLAVLSDSFLSFAALQRNLEGNGIGPESVLRLDPSDILDPGQTGDEPGTLPRRNSVFVRLPRSLDRLGFYLAAARLMLAPGGRVYLGGMDRRWNKSLTRLASDILGDGNPGKFHQRARWIEYPNAAPLSRSRFDEMTQPFHREYRFGPNSYTQLPGVFSAAHPDPGARFLLAELEDILKELPAGADMADLGCGNGILGIEAALRRDDIRLHFADESRLSVMSCETNWKRNIGTEAAEFIWGNGLEAQRPASLDVVLCNPPFHHANVQTREVAGSMFADARRCLRTEGMLYVVGNAHLGYHRLLGDFFSRIAVIRRSQKFVLIQARQ
jgi:23S rRNA (guanine1835-N2)-methyltransferase